MKKAKQLKDIKVITPIGVYNYLQVKMRTDIIIKFEGMKILREKLYIVEAEKFIGIILRESFDYTEWRQNFWKDKSIDEIFNAAKPVADKEAIPKI